MCNGGIGRDDQGAFLHHNRCINKGPVAFIHFLAGVIDGEGDGIDFPAAFTFLQADQSNAGDLRQGGEIRQGNAAALGVKQGLRPIPNGWPAKWEPVPAGPPQSHDRR